MVPRACRGIETTFLRDSLLAFGLSGRPWISVVRAWFDSYQVPYCFCRRRSRPSGRPGPGYRYRTGGGCGPRQTARFDLRVATQIELPDRPRQRQHRAPTNRRLDMRHVIRTPSAFALPARPTG